MSNYAIGIGGTGAKCLEALSHMCAAGLLPNADNGGLYMVFVDPDKANGNLERSNITVKQYNNVKKINFGNSPLFRTNIEIAVPAIWSPFESIQTPMLDDYFSKSTLGKGYQQLFDVLYSKKEQQTSLDKGFRGHPSIGAAVMAHSIKFGEREPWITFKAKLEQDISSGDARIFLFGSIFGGTGASGLPTITQLILNVLKDLGVGAQATNFKIGASLMLPYFSFTSDDVDSELKARTEEFLVNSQASLKYYCQQIGDSPTHSLNFDSLYLLGCQSLQSYTKDKTSLGGAHQKNNPHYVELYAALAALDFYRKPLPKFKENPTGHIVNLIARSESPLSWQDLPDVPGVKNLKEDLGQMAKFSFAYLSEFLPVLKKIKSSGTGNQEAWYVDYFERKLGKKTLDDIWPKLTSLQVCCSEYLTWFSALHTEDVNLLEVSSFSNQNPQDPQLLTFDRFNKGRFPQLVSPAVENGNKGNLFDVINALSKNEKQDGRACEVGNFAQALYNACSV
ncbi:MAG: hypothetical protein PF495_16940 [Spirochaetales bacterium]|nr:hypothetical protein [Spirochaetales bacterium]